MPLKTLQQFAVKTALKAGSYLLEHQSKARVVENKDVRDIATTADLGSEKIIVREIKKKFPNHNIKSEELGFIDNGSIYTWVIDPLDGTKEYAADIPIFGVLITCETKLEILAGCAYFPKTDEVYSAAKGIGSFKKTRKLRVSSKSTLEKSIVACKSPTNRLSLRQADHWWKAMIKVQRSVYRIRPSHFDANYLCWLAMGGIDGYFLLDEGGPEWHDIAAGLLVAKEAGAKITDLNGKEIVPDNRKAGIVVSNGRIHDQLISLLK